jgi:uncharacterized membrane-anchored protein
MRSSAPFWSGGKAFAVNRTTGSVLTLAFACAALAGAIIPARAATGVDEQLRNLHWQTGTRQLAQSHGSFAVPPHAKMLTGADATRFDEAINGQGDSDSEGVVVADHRTLYLSYDDSGHVTADDWNDVDAHKMLADMKQSTDDGNAERTKSGVAAFHVDRWVQPPVYDAAHASVRWIVGMHDDGGQTFINAVALALGRHGYERFTLVSDGKNPAADRSALAAFTNDYSFDRGSRFGDYVQGDKLAGFGLAALVGTAAGVTLAKTGMFAAILLFAKKFIILILAAGAALFGRFRRMFSGGAKFGPPSRTPPAAPPAP